MDSAFLNHGVPCRACGAVAAPAGDNGFGLCQHCWNAAEAHCGYEVPTDADVTRWLASKLVKDLKRFQRNGLAGRCEVASGWSTGNPGHQCAMPATLLRDGRKVCASHFKASAPVYVTERARNHYEMLRDLLSDLATADPKFALILSEVASA